MSASRVSLLVVLALFVPTAQSAYAQQCTCDELKPCVEKIQTSLPQCTNYCSSTLTAIGIDLDAAKECVDYYTPEINATISCIRNQLSSSCAKTTLDVNKHVVKRNADTLKLAILSELNRWMSENGGVQLKQTVAQSLQFVICTKRCLDIRTAKCADKFDCVLELPSDQVIIDTAKRCINTSWSTEKARDLCSCLAQSGFQKLTSVCPKINIGDGSSQ